MAGGVASRVDWKPDCAGGGVSIATTVSITPDTQQPAVSCSSVTAGALTTTGKGASEVETAAVKATATAAMTGKERAATLVRPSRSSRPRPKTREWSFSCASAASPSTPLVVGRAGDRTEVYGGGSISRSNRDDADTIGGGDGGDGGGDGGGGGGGVVLGVPSVAGDSAVSPSLSLWRREEGGCLDNSRDNGGAGDPQDMPAPPSPTGDEEEPTGRQHRVGWDSARAAQALKACKAWRDSPLSTEVEGDAGDTPHDDRDSTIAPAAIAARAVAAAAGAAAATSALVSADTVAVASESRCGRPKTGSAVGWNPSRVGNPAVPAPVEHVVAAVRVAEAGVVKAEATPGRDSGGAAMVRRVTSQGAGGRSAQGEMPLQLRAVLLYASAQRGIDLRRWFDLGGTGEGDREDEEAAEGALSWGTCR